MKNIATFLLAIALTSCFPQKVSQVAEIPENIALDPVPTQTELAEVTTEKTEPPQPPVVRNTGLRLPSDIESLPQDDQLRSAPTTPKDGKATVIARPPAE